MPRPLLIRLLSEDLPIKVVSMALAVALFALVRNDKDVSGSAYVKVVYTPPDDRVLVSEPVGEVKVSLRGPWAKLQRSERSIEPLRIDLNRVHESELRFEEEAIKVPGGVRVLSVSPAETHLDFEPRRTAEVVVQPIFEGGPAEGYRVAKVTVTPPKVRIDGAKSRIDALERLPTQPFRVAGARAPLRGTVELAPPPLHTRFEDAGSVSVEVEVQPAILEQTFENLPIQIVGLERLEGAVEPRSARLTLRGPSVLLGEVQREKIDLKVEASFIDHRPPGRFVRSLVVSGLPAGIGVEVQPDSVVLTTQRKRS